MNNPTPMKWMGKTIEQEHILRYIDRENPFGEIIRVSHAGARALIVTDSSCTDHLLVCLADGEVVERFEEVESA